mgnify:CR=1 FL=1
MNQSKELTPVSTISICMKTEKLSEGFSSKLVSWILCQVDLSQVVYQQDYPQN